MTVHLVTFSDESMSRSRELCVESALRHGCDAANGWGLSYLRQFPSFREDWSANRGFGWWHWKPIVIQQALHEHLTNDIVIWADAGIEFIAPVSHIIERMDQDIFLFGNNWEHAHWCKRDVIEAVWPWWERGRTLDMSGDRDVFVFSRFHKDNREQHWINVRQLAWERFHKQVQASVIFFRVSDYSREFVAEWLKWCLHRERVSTICSDEWRYLIDDSPSILPNHPEFREHRHDQAILTTMAYREGIKLHWWPAIYNRGGSPEFVYEKLPEYVGDTYPVIFSHHRKRNHEYREAISVNEETKDLSPEDVIRMPLAEFERRFGFCPVDAFEKKHFAITAKRPDQLMRDAFAAGLIEDSQLGDVVMQ